MKYFSKRKNIKIKILILLFDKDQIWKPENPQLSPWVIELRRISRINQNAKVKYDMHDDLMYNIPNWKFGML